jgi:hypothetical protein
VLLPNGYYAFSSGYFTENEYKMMVNGTTLHKTDIQEAVTLFYNKKNANQVVEWIEK